MYLIFHSFTELINRAALMRHNLILNTSLVEQPLPFVNSGYINWSAPGHFCLACSWLGWLDNWFEWQIGGKLDYLQKTPWTWGGIWTHALVKYIGVWQCKWLGHLGPFGWGVSSLSDNMWMNHVNKKQLFGQTDIFGRKSGAEINDKCVTQFCGGLLRKQFLAKG